MKIKRIFAKNAIYQKFEVLKTNRNKRHKFKEFFVEGVSNINEAIRNNWKINSFIYSYEKPLSSWATNLLNETDTIVNYELTDSLMKDLSTKEDTSEVLAIINMRNNEENEIKFSESPILALFDRPSNRGNLGTLIRSCDALGVDGLIITGHAVDIYDPSVVSSSMGSFFKVPFITMSDNADISDYIRGLIEKFPQLKVIGTTSHCEKNIFEVNLTTPILFLIGNETHGLNKYLTEMCHVMVKIPMSEKSFATSFNVSCAATIMFYEANRQRLI